jgi:hemerythrin-like metal-binding protein
MAWEDPILYQWDSTLETGYELIDSQHKQLIGMVNKLIEASSSGKSAAVVTEALDFLASYAVNHFADEEKLQVKYSYPDYVGHKRKHDEVKVVVEGLVQRVKNEGPTEELIEEVCFTIGSWLLEHIMGDDFRMAKFVKAADITGN